jgi:hypothetical protein
MLVIPSMLKLCQLDLQLQDICFSLNAADLHFLLFPLMLMLNCGIHLFHQSLFTQQLMLLLMTEVFEFHLHALVLVFLGLQFCLLHGVGLLK